jgi:hypothetical protein
VRHDATVRLGARFRNRTAFDFTRVSRHSWTRRGRRPRIEIVNASTRATRPRAKLGCAYVAFPLLLIAFGLAAVSAGRQLAPESNAAAQLFRSDPSCVDDLTARVPAGACKTVAATVLLAEMHTSGSGKTPARTPFVHLRYADGTFHDAELDGGAGEVFVYSVPSGALARAQIFRGDLVRVTSGNSTAETVSAPDVNAETVGELPWVGAAAIVSALLIFVARIYVVRRAG